MALNGAGHDSFDVVSNPEFLREGSAVLDFLYPDRIVIGADSERSANLVSEVYLPLTSGEYHSLKTALPAPKGACVPSPLVVTSAKSAELIKHASNAFLATKISFINAIASICESVGADVTEVCKGMAADSRIGNRFLNPGIGYGGSCFPKDLTAFRSVAHECGYEFGLLDQVTSINEQQRTRFLKKVRQALWNIKRKRLAVLGLAFKGGTDDIRESPALAIVNSLVEEGALVTAYDPAAMQRTKEEIGNSISYADSAYAACDEADALLILTDWAEFAQLDLKRLKSLLRYPIIVDGRNLYEPAAMKEAGIQYHSVGRPAVVLATKPVLVDAAKDPRISVETQNPHSAAPISFSVSVP
jgi:UDPglucose 6-dehydrogenase